MKIRVLTSNCKKGDCGPKCPYCRLDEATSTLGGDWAPKTEHGILQEAPENIIPPAFNRLLAFAKLGHPAISEASITTDWAVGHMDLEQKRDHYMQAMADNIERNQMKNKAAQDVFAQYIVRYVGRSWETRRGSMIDFAFNADAVNKTIHEAMNRVNFGRKGWESFKKNVMNGEERLETPEEDAIWNQYQRKWFDLLDNLSPEEDTSRDWVKKGRQMAADGATAPELLVMMGKQYKSKLKTIKKFFQKNPELPEVEIEALELVRRNWDYFQDQVVSHGMGNLRKIGKFLEEDKYVNELGALLKRHPSRNTYNDDTDEIERDSLYHANEFLDNEMLKKQLDHCKEGFESAMRSVSDEGDEESPCVLKEYDDGLFWWDRRASSCEIAGEDMANCGASNYESSTLIILKEKLVNDSAEVMDKLKGRIMVEYNPNHNEIVQILGFANSFPEQQYWEKIKDLHEGLNKPKIDRRAFVHLAGMGRTDEETISEFLAFLGGEESRAPKSFWREDSHVDSMIDRIANRYYDIQEDGPEGGRQSIRFTSGHRADGVNTYYAPITVEAAVRPKPMGVPPEVESTENHPALEQKLFDSIKLSAGQASPEDLSPEREDKVYELMEKSVQQAIKRAIMNMEPDTRGEPRVAAGGAREAAERSAETLEWVRWNVQVREIPERKEGGAVYPARSRARFNLRFKFDIVPEVFTYEDIGNEDDPQADLSHEIISNVRRNLSGGRLLKFLNTAISIENARFNPEKYSVQIPGVDDEEEGEDLGGNPPTDQQAGEMSLEDTMRAFTRIGGRLTDVERHQLSAVLDNMVERVPYTNQLKIDLVGSDAKHEFGVWLTTADPDAAERFVRIQQDAQIRRINQIDDDDDDITVDDVENAGMAVDRRREYFGREHSQGVLRWMRDDRPSRSVAGRYVRRVLNGWRDHAPDFEEWDTNNMDKAQLNAIDANYDIERIGLDDDDINDVENIIHDINMGRYSRDEPSEEERNWRPGMPTPGGAADYQARLDQANAEEFVRQEELPLADRLRIRARMFSRLIDSQPDRWARTQTTSIWQTLKQEMKDNGIFVDWLESLPSDHPIRQTELEDAHRDANMTDRQRNLLNRAAMLMRYIEQTPRRVENPAFKGTLERFKGRMQDEGLWDSWWDSLPASNPLKTSGILDEDQTLVEARKVLNSMLGKKQSNNIKIRIDEGDVIDFQTRKETTVDEHFLDFLEEKIPSLDVENPVEVKAVIRSIENHDTAEEVFSDLERMGIVTRHMDSAYESSMWQISQIQSIMTSHWFGKIEQLFEGQRKKAVGILPYRMIDGVLEFLIGEMTNIYHALPEEKPEEGYHSKWTCFKGKVDKGEDEKTAARREFQEESTFSWDGKLDDSLLIQNRKTKVWLVDAADFDPAEFNREDVNKITGEYLNGLPEIWNIGWFSPEETQSKLANSQKDLIPQAVELLTDFREEPFVADQKGQPYAFGLNESEGATNLHIFDFDDTIAFTTSYTQVTVPEGETEAAQILSQLDQEPPGPPYALDQHGLDKMFRDVGSEEELAARGFDLDFSSFKTVAASSPLNPIIASRIEQCCLIGGEDPVGEFYVLTARSRAAEGSIHQYLKDNGIDIDRKRIRGVEGGLKSLRIKEWILSRSVRPEKVIFYDDSENNIADVATLRQDDDLKGIVFELYPVDKQGKIPKKPLQETNYRRKRFKIRIGAK